MAEIEELREVIEIKNTGIERNNMESEDKTAQVIRVEGKLL